MIYRVTGRGDGTFVCECSVQDGTERWTEDDKDAAIRSVVRAARTFNGCFIRPDEVEFVEFSLNTKIIASDEQLLRNIRCGQLIVLKFNDPRIAYRLTNEELQLILDIREGVKQVV